MTKVRFGPKSRHSRHANEHPLFLRPSTFRARHIAEAQGHVPYLAASRVNAKNCQKAVELNVNSLVISKDTVQPSVIALEMAGKPGIEPPRQEFFVEPIAGFEILHEVANLVE